MMLKESVKDSEKDNIKKYLFDLLFWLESVKISSLTLVKVKNSYKPSNYAGCSCFPFGNDLCYFFASSVLVLFMMLRMAALEINS